ncbi:MFS transporter [Halomontanus rarus]|uniref:MFS transporter n=1 Tax=Halomontanus rarus TaxID=3034020 RepID=UPI001A99D386
MPDDDRYRGEGPIVVTLESAVRRRQLAILVAIAISHITAGALFGTSVAYYIGLEGSPFLVSLAFAVFSLGLLVFAPVWGAIADITGRRKAVVVGTSLGTVLAVAPLTAANPVWLEIASRGLFAVFVAGFQSTMLTIVSESGGDHGRGRAIGFYSSAESVGDIVGQLLVGYLLGVLFPNQLYLVIVVVGIVSTTLVLLITDPTPEPDEPATVARFRDEFRRRFAPRSVRNGFPDGHGLGWLYVGLFLRNMTQKGVSAVLPVYLTQTVGLTEFLMGVVLAVSPTIRTVAMYGFGRLSDAIGRKHLIVLGIGGAAGQALVLVGATIPTALPARVGLSALAFVVHAVTFSALTIGTIAFISDVAPLDRESELIGLRSTARGAGGVVGPLAVGALATVTDYPTSFVVISVVSIVATVLVATRVTESYEGSGGLEAASGEPAE